MTGYRGPTVDHSLLSPSGRVSGAARRAALAREHDRLFPPGYWDRGGPTDAERNAARAAALRRQAATLRDLAGRGMRPRAYRREAARLDAEADTLTTGD